MLNEWTAVAASKQLCFLKPYISARGIFDARGQPDEQQSSWLKIRVIPQWFDTLCQRNLGLNPSHTMQSRALPWAYFSSLWASTFPSVKWEGESDALSGPRRGRKVLELCSLSLAREEWVESLYLSHSSNAPPIRLWVSVTDAQQSLKRLRLSNIGESHSFSASYVFLSVK